MTQVVGYNQFEQSRLSYTKPVIQHQIYYGSINYDDNACYIQSNKLLFEGIKVDKISKQKHIILSVNPDDFSFYDCLVKLDDHNLATTYKSSKEWFNKSLPMDVLETMYRRITKPFKKDKVPMIELKIPVDKQKCLCNIYDQSNNSISLDSLSKGSSIIAIIHMKGLKFLKKTYYCDIYISQIKLCQSATYSIPTECLIIDNDETNNKYDYEILDEEVILISKQKLELEELMKELKNKMEEDKTELLTLQRKINNLN